MKTINNRQELNSYYSLVNSKLDNYVTEYKIRPSELIHYVKANMEEMKEEMGVSDVFGIDKVILDVVSHYSHSELDEILKFESFILRFK